MSPILKKNLYSSEAYFEHVCHDIDSAQRGDRVLSTTMAFDAHYPAVSKVLTSLGKAAQRGVVTDLQVDANAFMDLRHGWPGPLVSGTRLENRHHAKPFREQYEHLTHLQEQGVTVTITNPPERRFQSPFTGRSHIKTTIINDLVYMGGCNLHAPHSDCMVSWRDKTSANWLYNLMIARDSQPQTLTAWGTHDLRQTLDSQSELILDVGVTHQSAIYDEALAAIDRAKEWLVITCQYFPHSTTAKHLREAHRRGVKVLPIFNHYRAHSLINRPLQFGVTQRERLRMPASFFAGQLPPGANYLHAKVLASEQEVFVGSHNYIPTGVTFGTAELALHSKDPALSQGLVRLVINQTGITIPEYFAFLQAT